MTESGVFNDTATLGPDTYTFTGVGSLPTTFVGSSSGATTVYAGGTGGYSFTGQGTGNSLNLSAANSGITVSAASGTVSGLSSGTDTFSGIASFTGSSTGDTTFAAGPTGGYSFTGQGTGNSLNLSAAPTGTTVTLNGDSTTSPGVVADLDSGLGGSTSDLFSGIQSFNGVPPPTVSGISPSSGPSGGGTTVTLTGTNLSGTYLVQFGTSTATDVTVVSPTEVTAVSPGGTGSVTVSLTTPGGEVVSPTEFTYVPPPTVSGISPSSGPSGGGTTVTLTGTNLSGTYLVQFGTSTATDVTVVSPTEVTAVSPGGTGSVTVSLTTPGGEVVSPTEFTYVPPPTVSGISPSSGPSGGGTTVTLTGTNLSGTYLVQFGTSTATDVTVVSPTEVTAVSPGGTGSVTVSLTTPGGEVVSPTEFTYVPPPTVSGISPSSGPSGGGTTVTLTGTNLSGTYLVQFGTSTATDVTVVSPTEVTAVSPGGTGSVTVSLTTPGGEVVSPTEFTYVPPPTVSGISPSSGPSGGGTTVTLTGTNLSGTYLVQFGTSTATDVTVVSPTEVTAVSPGGTGSVTVSLTTPGGEVVSPTEFTYVPPPTVTALTYTGTNQVGINSSFTPTATLTSAAPSCYMGQPVSFSLSVNPTNQAAGPYALGAATDSSSTGLATGTLVKTTGWENGVYMISASFAGTTNCVASTATAVLAVTSPGQFAFGAGRYTVPGVGQTSFGFVVSQGPKNTYTGQLNVVTPGKWWFQANVTSFGLTSAIQALLGGTGNLYSWKTTLNKGHGGWQLVRSGVTYKATANAATKTTTATFGITINYTPSSGLPNSLPIALSAGGIYIA